MVYSEFDEFASDAELLITRTECNSFDYVEGFVFVNSDDPINGWSSVPLGSNQRFDHFRIPRTAGPVLYCLEVAFHYRNEDDPITIDRVHLVLLILKYSPFFFTVHLLWSLF